MAIITGGALSANVASKLRGVVDFYYWKGLLVARRYPTRCRQPGTPAQKNVWIQVRDAAQQYGWLHDTALNGWRGWAKNTNWSSRDAFCKFFLKRQIYGGGNFNTIRAHRYGPSPWGLGVAFAVRSDARFDVWYSTVPIGDEDTRVFCGDETCCQRGLRVKTTLNVVEIWDHSAGAQKKPGWNPFSDWNPGSPPPNVYFAVIPHPGLGQRLLYMVSVSRSVPIGAWGRSGLGYYPPHPVFFPRRKYT